MQNFLFHAEDFTIHGLWPNYDHGAPPEDCPGPAFSPTAISDLESELNKNWPSLTGECPSGTGPGRAPLKPCSNANEVVPLRRPGGGVLVP